jgi:hypothetical protein
MDEQILATIVPFPLLLMRPIVDEDVVPAKSDSHVSLQNRFRRNDNRFPKSGST